jgi:hypothetical protein
MTFSARFKVQDVGEGPAPIDVIAVASVEDGTLTQNTERARSMELRIQLETDETTLAEGQEIVVTGHFLA